MNFSPLSKADSNRIPSALVTFWLVKETYNLKEEVKISVYEKLERQKRNRIFSQQIRSKAGCGGQRRVVLATKQSLASIQAGWRTSPHHITQTLLLGEGQPQEPSVRCSWRRRNSTVPNASSHMQNVYSEHLPRLVQLSYEKDCQKLWLVRNKNKGYKFQLVGIVLTSLLRDDFEWSPIQVKL
jgi:hypothetical protein